MGRLAALGCDVTPITRAPLFMAPLWVGIAEIAEKRRAEWAEVDGVATINALGESM